MLGTAGQWRPLLAECAPCTVPVLDRPIGRGPEGKVHSPTPQSPRVVSPERVWSVQE